MNMIKNYFNLSLRYDRTNFWFITFIWVCYIVCACIAKDLWFDKSSIYGNAMLSTGSILLFVPASMKRWNDLSLICREIANTFGIICAIVWVIEFFYKNSITDYIIMVCLLVIISLLLFAPSSTKKAE